MNREKQTKEQLIAEIERLEVDIDLLRADRMKSNGEINRLAIESNKQKYEIVKLNQKIENVKKGARFEVASTLRTARFLIDSFAFDTFTHRQKINLASRYSQMIKAKEQKLIDDQIESEYNPF